MFDISFKGRLFDSKRDEVTINAKTWMELENIMLLDRSQSQKTTYFITNLYGMYKTGACMETERLLVA